MNLIMKFISFQFSKALKSFQRGLFYEKSVIHYVKKVTCVIKVTKVNGDPHDRK